MLRSGEPLVTMQRIYCSSFCASTKTIVYRFTKLWNTGGSRWILNLLFLCLCGRDQCKTCLHCLICIQNRDKCASRDHLHLTVEEMRIFNARRKLKSLIVATANSIKWGHPSLDPNCDAFSDIDEDESISNSKSLLFFNGEFNSSF